MTESADSDIVLDYRYGWRWLIPLETNDRLAIFGLDDESASWWQQRYHMVEPGFAAEGLLLMLDELTVNQVEQSLAQHLPRWVCAWGTGKNVKRLAHHLDDYTEISCYGLLPANKPRIVVPFSSPQAAAAGLHMHRPGRGLARAAIGIAAALARIGSYQLLQKKMLLIACREVGPTPLRFKTKAANLPSYVEDFVLYLGALEKKRKTVALPVPISSHHPIIKVGETPLACQALRNEADALSYLRETELQGQVPGLLAIRDTGETVTLTQEYRQRRAVAKRRHQSAVIEFLGALTSIDRRQVNLGDLLEQLEHSLPDEYLALSRRLTAMPRSTPVLCYRSHGDFAPWNCCWSDGGLFVYDWESSRPDGLALADAFYYVLAPILRVRRATDGRKALRFVLAFARQVAGQASMKDIDICLHLALWLLQQPTQPLLYRNVAAELLEAWP